jgi:CRP-like cAMP-binding protein
MTRDFIHSVAPSIRANSLRWLLPAMSQTYPRNHLLAALTPDVYQRLPLELVTLPVGQVLYEPNQTIEYAYFPATAIISHLNLMQTERSVEAFSIGNEGMIGIPLVLGSDRILLRAMVQISGLAWRISAFELQTELHRSPALRSLLLRYVQTLMSQIAQDLTCTQIHSTQERCCYLLLLMQDRIGNPVLPLTQTLLARIVGVRRDRISEIIAMLERADLLQHQRGKLIILDRLGLEAAACHCYQTVRDRFDSEFH